MTLALVLRYWKVAAGAALVLLLLGTGWKARGWREDSLKLPQVQAELKTVTEERDTLRGAVDSWTKAAADAEERARAAEAKAGQVRVEWRTRVETVTHEVPTPDARCEEVLAWEDARYAELVKLFRGTP
jgi:hypothetical protein